MKLVDLLHTGVERTIGVYLLETEDGLALVDCGPASCLPELERHVPLGELRHLLLTHIHLDHAGATGTIVRRFPSVRVHVSEVGAPHLVDPSRLERSARRLYGDTFDPLWGELAPVPQENVLVVGGRAVGLDVLPAPGHASHQVAYVDGEGTLFPGDAAGVRIVPGEFVLPVSPPPDFDPEAWERTLDAFEALGAARIALPHFGVVEDVAAHLERQRAAMREWTARGEEAGEQEWVAAAKADIEASDGPELVEAYDRAAPLWQSYAGLARYWTKRREAA